MKQIETFKLGDDECVVSLDIDNKLTIRLTNFTNPIEKYEDVIVDVLDLVPVSSLPIIKKGEILFMATEMKRGIIIHFRDVCGIIFGHVTIGRNNEERYLKIIDYAGKSREIVLQKTPIVKDSSAAPQPDNTSNNLEIKLTSIEQDIRILIENNENKFSTFACASFIGFLILLVLITVLAVRLKHQDEMLENILNKQQFQYQNVRDLLRITGLASLSAQIISYCGIGGALITIAYGLAELIKKARNPA